MGTDATTYRFAGAARAMALLALMALVAACAGRWETSYATTLSSESSRAWRLADVIVTVPAGASTTELNTFAPTADIVWHGEPLGDRKAQVAALMEEGILRGGRGLNGPRAITITALVERFHGVTPRAVMRAPAAVHSISYTMQVFDANTGEEITRPIPVRADLEALVGPAAISAAMQGQDQRTRIVNHIAAVTAGMFSLGPDQRRSFSGLGR